MLLFLLPIFFLFGGNTYALPSYALPSHELRSLLREVELDHQTLEQIKNDQTRIYERLTLLEKQISALQKEIEKRDDRAPEKSLQSSWIQQVDQNILLLQKSLQSLAKAIDLLDDIPNKESESLAEGQIKKDFVYTVQMGDSLSKIAQKHKTTIQALRENNQLASSKIEVGQKLKISSSLRKARAP